MVSLNNNYKYTEPFYGIGKSKGNKFRINTEHKPNISYSVRLCAVGIKEKSYSLFRQ